MATTECMIAALDNLRREPGEPANAHFWNLVERFRAGLIQQALLIIGNQADAEDAAQKSICTAFLDLHRLRDTKKLGVWLRKINRCNALQVRRKRNAAHKEQHLSTTQFLSLEAPKPDELEPHKKEAVMRSLETLPETFREVLMLRYWEKLSYEEISKRLGVPLGTICSRISRADDLLIAKLEKHIQ